MKTCLIVDDSKVIRKVARHILETLDFQVDEACDGVSDARCEASMPDVVLSDWKCRCERHGFLRLDSAVTEIAKVGSHHENDMPHPRAPALRRIFMTPSTEKNAPSSAARRRR